MEHSVASPWIMTMVYFINFEFLLFLRMPLTFCHPARSPHPICRTHRLYIHSHFIIFEYRKSHVHTRYYINFCIECSFRSKFAFRFFGINPLQHRKQLILMISFPVKSNYIIFIWYNATWDLTDVIPYFTSQNRLCDKRRCMTVANLSDSSAADFSLEIRINRPRLMSQ